MYGKAEGIKTKLFYSYEKDVPIDEQINDFLKIDPNIEVLSLTHSCSMTDSEYGYKRLITALLMYRE
ncbi:MULTISPECIES: hypothetical protein [Thermoanaerobacterium]|uniref:Uncharacterized protein n=3 Tax=Thermoanaerobacterium TaxID=28895 RepID=L0ILG7_THETR|nr:MULTISPECIES: hypothetical protein [Thermoanaerobacterium]AFK94307.1 hypothetical protein Tsac_2760 [Thermoanaerobacterium saccharolyticum JW/SL-YS485]AGB20345.1 hypothetical protein Thethe_02791 [Thermoanaerobacterium thermosaccharolyticum M0795]ETO37223.1 hypothetical protein V518_2628 [Thermoanaerobacterium aotearoense SCUT27]